MSARLDVLRSQVESNRETIQNLRKRKIELESSVSRLQKSLENIKHKIADEVYYNLDSMAAGLPKDILDSYAHKFKVTEEGSTYYPGRKYSEEIRKFALTLYGYSRKSYDYVRESMDNCLPSESTIKNWLSKVDSSAGFCSQALAQLKSIVKQQDMISQKVLTYYNHH